MNLICSNCKYERDVNIWWCHIKRFVKKNTLSKEEQIQAAIAEENYELSHELSKI